MWNVIRAEAVGRSHVKSNLPCQDKTFACSWGAAQAFALCDGAGSARLSHYGAQVAAQAACGVLARGFEGYYSGGLGAAELVGAVLAALGREAQARGCELRELASTLLAVAVKDGRFVCVHIGDGVIGALREIDGRGGFGGADGTNSNLTPVPPAGVSFVNGAALEVISPPQNDEFANVTTFVTSSGAVARARVWRGELRGAVGSIGAGLTGADADDKIGASGASGADENLSASENTNESAASDPAKFEFGEIRAFILMSDGTQQGLYDKRAGTLAAACERLARLCGVLDCAALTTQMQATLDGVLTRVTSDDCSIVLAARLGAGFAALGAAGQRRLLGLSRGADVAGYARILGALRKPRTLGWLANALRAKPHVVRSRLARLCERNFVTQRGDEFERIIIM